MLARGREQHRTPTIVTAATEKEARRVLEWQEDVARSCSGTSPTRSRANDEHRAPAPSQVSRNDAPPFRRAETFPRLMKREMDHYHQDSGATQVDVRRYQGNAGEQVYVDEVEPKEQEQEKQKTGLLGMTNKGLIGTFLGAAAGAAFAYAMVKSEDPEYELEPETPKPMPLRRSYTAGHAETIASSRSSIPERSVRVIEAPMPPPAGPSSYSQAPRRASSRDQRGDLSPIEERGYYSTAPPAQSRVSFRRRSVTEQERDEDSQAGTARPPTTINTKAQSVAPTHVTRRSGVSEKASTIKAPSRAPTQVSRAPTQAAPSHVSRAPSRNPTGVAKSHISENYEYITAEPVRHAPSQAPTSLSRRPSDDNKSKVSHSHTTIKFSPSKVGDARIPRSEATWERDDEESTISRSTHNVGRARDIPLPASTVVSARYGGGYREQGGGYTHAPAPVREERGRDDDGKSYFMGRSDAMSVAPSDSVSSVGSKRERLERLRGRMERA